MDEVILELLVELLFALALLTKVINQNRQTKFTKRLRGENEAEAAEVVRRLDRLTQNETQMAAAQTLEIVDGLVKDVKVVIDVAKTSVDLIHDIQIEANKSKREKLQQDIRSWLSPPDPWKNHNIVSKSRHRGTGAWFVEGDTYSEWKASRWSPLLWIHGKPGSGKSTLCSTIIQNIGDLQRSGLASLAIFYCDSEEDQKKNMRGLLSSVLFQLCDQSNFYHDILSHLYVTHRHGAQDPSDNALARCLMDILICPGQAPVFVVIDGLDECSNTSAIPSPRRSILLLLEELISSGSPNLHICITSRHEIDIQEVLQPLTFHSVSLYDEAGQMDDIADYVRSIVNTDPEMRGWNRGDKRLVIDVLTERADGVFRWVYCQLVYLRGCPPGRIRRALTESPEMLDEMYERILQEIQMAKWESAHLLFQCVAVASRPLHVEELAESLALDFETGPIPKFHEGWRPENPLTAVLSICPTLLTTICVENILAIQFTHVSAKEFLTSARLAKKPDITSRRFHISLTLAHTHVAQVCLGILVHLDENITSDSLSKYPLAAYAAEHWDYHAKMGNVSRSVEDGIKVLLDPKKPHLAIWVWLYDAEALRSGTDWSERPIQPGGIPLHYAALCGLHTIVNSLVVERPQDVNARRFDDNSTPLHLASARGQMEAARVLLERGADVNARDHSNWTPLHEASRFGDSDTVHFLLEHCANVHAVDHGGWTPLHLSSYNGHLGVVLALVEHGIDVNARDNSNWTPLHGASQQGHLEVAQVLLEHGAGANFGDCRNQTPLHSASQRGHVEVAQVLLEHGGNGNSRDDGNETPMHLASRAGYLGLVRLLVEHGAAASVYVRNEKNHTPFQEASAKGHHDVMQLLLEYGTQEIEEAI